jgi:transposase-like protein
LTFKNKLLRKIPIFVCEGKNRFIIFPWYDKIICSSLFVPVKNNTYNRENKIDMNIIKFVTDFPDELSCKEHFRLLREQQGITCKQCGGTHQYWLKGKFQWQCADCNFRTTIRSGTMMEHSNLPIRKWYLAMAFMSFSKKGISATELQRQLNHKRYEPIWRMMHKIRAAMGQRDSKYQLEGMIEFDEGYFATEINTKKKEKIKAWQRKSEE